MAFEALLDTVAPLSAATGVPIEITFDDGNLSDATIALPALVKRGLRATFFVCAGRIGQPGYLDALALREMLSAGMAIGSHGWQHVDWRHCDDAVLERETQGALDAIGDVLGQTINQVGVPFGSYDRRVLSRLRRCALRTVFTSDGGRAQATGWLVPRHSYTNDWQEGKLGKLATAADGVLAKAKQALVRTLKQLR
jgi:peptidoglycan/xylan/chitin deacetylase (PgdA/CDA1 family)